MQNYHENLTLLSLQQMKIHCSFAILDKYLYLFVPCSKSKPKLCFSQLWAIASLLSHLQTECFSFLSILLIIFMQGAIIHLPLSICFLLHTFTLVITLHSSHLICCPFSFKFVLMLRSGLILLSYLLSMFLYNTSHGQNQTSPFYLLGLGTISTGSRSSCSN